MTSASLAPSLLVTLTGPPGRVTETEVPPPTTSTVIVAVGAVSRSPCLPAASPVVPPIVPARLTFTSMTSVPLRSLTVTCVGAAQRIERRPLDVVEVHDDVAEIAREAHPRAVCGRLEDSSDPCCR